MSPSIFFFSEDIDFKIKDEVEVTKWITSIIHSENFTIDNINYIFCSDMYLHKINLEHLNHDTYTDIITFDLSDNNSNTICSDIFISIDRITDNSKINTTRFEDELHRVLIHGALHLMTYNDKTDDQKMIMRKKEDACLSLRTF